MDETSMDAATRRVEELVAAHDVHVSPTERGTLRARIRRSHCNNFSTEALRHAETALRAAVAACLVGLWHLHARNGASYLAAAISTLCTCGTVGGTLQRAVQATGGACSMVPLSLAAIAAARATHSVVGILLLCVWSFAAGASTLPPPALKTLLALSAGSVTSGLLAPPGVDASAALLPLHVNPVVAVFRGALCALVAVILVPLPRPRLATSAARAALQQAAAGVALLYAGATQQPQEKGAGGSGAQELQWRLESDRLSAAVAHQLEEVLPGALEEARWEARAATVLATLAMRGRRAGAAAEAATAWDAAQARALRELLGLALATDQAMRGLRESGGAGGDPSLAAAVLSSLRGAPPSTAPRPGPAPSRRPLTPAPPRPLCPPRVRIGRRDA